MAPGRLVTKMAPILGSHTRQPSPEEPVRQTLSLALTCSPLAERVGFEPTVSFPTHDFQSRQAVPHLSAAVHQCWSERVSNPSASQVDQLSPPHSWSVSWSKLVFQMVPVLKVRVGKVKDMSGLAGLHFPRPGRSDMPLRSAVARTAAHHSQ